MPAGRPATIPALRMLTGTHRPDRHGPEAVALEAARTAPNGVTLTPISATPPDHLFPEAAAYWRHLHGALVEYGYVDVLDTAMVSELCIVVGDLQIVHEAINAMREADPRFGGMLIASSHGPVVNPLRKEARRLRSDLVQLSVALGLTPIVRQRLALIESGETQGSNFSKYFDHS